MDALKRAQTVPTFSVYPDKTSKKFIYHNFSEESMTISNTINLQEIISPKEDRNQIINSIITPSLPLESIPSFESTSSLSLKSDALAHKTGDQVRNKISSLINKYMEENSNKTGKGASNWPFYTEMNDIFRNRENVNPDYLINSTGQSIDIITQSKKIEVENKQKLLELEKEKLEFEKKNWKHEKNEKIGLEKYKLELEYKLQLELKTRELELKFKNKAVMENKL
ncbi:13037_t:CDS:2 [Dentiscutata heterogama]|uniref:13037_t:CDS:1 n=1 Tax=Dentiscutata heterogama TaxID=1316150 RepID=A0ACA9LL07_9GLOM|nr:13037_t:CDS:2 [Dentiscutata heterogama]